MAKQSGIHQLKGKVGEMSYYRQAGVAAGLVRKINQGMSDRVKYSDEYANTRLNNLEFKMANQIATEFYKTVNPAWRSMFRRFAIAKMTSKVLEYIKQGTGNWGYRIPSENLGVIGEDVLSNFAKAGKYDGQYGVISFTQEQQEVEDKNVNSITFDMTVDFNIGAVLASQGITGLRVYSTELLISEGGLLLAVRSTTEEDAGDVPTQSTDPNLVFSFGGKYAPSDFNIPEGSWDVIYGQSNVGLVKVVVIVPLTKVNGINYPLQEKSTFVVAGAQFK